MDGKFSIPISRRDLFKLAGLTAAGVVLSGSSHVVAEDNTSGNAIKYADKKIPVLYSVDVCVCGGGSSGTAAAVIAAAFGIENHIKANEIDWAKIPAHKRSYVSGG